MSNRRRLALGTAASFAALLLSASTAAAAIPMAGTDVATNLSGQMLHWASLILIPTAAIMALPALFKRDFGHAFVTLGLVLLVGALAFDPNGVKTLVEGLTQKILGG
jgi:hypothetical protein